MTAEHVVALIIILLVMAIFLKATKKVISTIALAGVIYVLVVYVLNPLLHGGF